jgi:Antibiotic biosynthesis monooxygenase
MKQQPGFISTQLHRSTAGSTTFVNVAAWESARALGQAFRSPEFQARAARATPKTPSPPRTCSRRWPSREFASPDAPTRRREKTHRMTSATLDRRQRLAGARRKLVLTVHVVAALALLGASIVLLVAGLHAATRDDAQEGHAIYSLLRLLTFSLDVPLALIALASGVLLALTSKWGIFRYWWVTTKLAILVTTIVLGATLIGPSISTMLDVTDTSDPSASGVRWRLVAVSSVQIVLLLANATLGVFKPGRRVQRRLARRPALD